MSFGETSYQSAIRSAETLETLSQLLRDLQKIAARDGITSLDDRLSRQFGSLKHIDVYGNRRQDEELAFRFFNWLVPILTPPNWEVHQRAVKFCRDNGIAAKALDEGINAAGGALIPPEFDRLIVRLIEANGVFRQNAKNRPMRSDLTSRPRRTGGVTTQWLGQGDAITASTPAYDSINLVAKKLAALTVASSEIDEDSALIIADEIASEIGIAFALAEDLAGFLGDASPTFGGVTGVTRKLLGLDATIGNIAGIKIAAGNLWSEFIFQDFLDAASLLPQYADNPRTAWYCNRLFYFNTMLRCALVGAAGVAAGGVVTTAPDGRPVFLGYPVNFTQVMPRTDGNSQIACLLGDLSLACSLGDRRMRSIFVDPFSLGASDSIQIRGIERLDLMANDVGSASATPSLRVPGPVVGLISAAA